MKYTALAFTLFVLISCNNADKQNEVETAEVNADTADIKTGTELPENTLTILNTTQVYRSAGERSTAIDWNSFKLTRFWTEDSPLVRPFQPNATYFDRYGQFLVYSPDSSKFIDLDSYNIGIRKAGNGRLIGEPQGPDTEITLVDQPNKLRTRLLFFGPGSSIEDAKWIDNENLLLIGTIERSNENDLNASIFRYNIPSKSFQVYETADQAIVDHLKGYSKRERLKAVRLE